MLDSVLTQGSQYLFSQGILGIIVMVLGWYVLQLRKENLDLRNAHKIEIASERKLNADLQERRLEDYKMLVDVSTSIKLGLDSVLMAIRNMRPT